jgi:hypothetical protein
MPIAHKLHIANLCLFLLLLTLPRVHHRPTRGVAINMASNAAVFLLAGGGRCNKYVAGCHTMLFQLDAICIVHGVVAVIARRLQ